jgi:hypothetical protein
MDTSPAPSIEYRRLTIDMIETPEMEAINVMETQDTVCVNVLDSQPMDTEDTAQVEMMDSEPEVFSQIYCSVETKDKLMEVSDENLNTSRTDVATQTPGNGGGVLPSGKNVASLEKSTEVATSVEKSPEVAVNVLSLETSYIEHLDVATQTLGKGLDDLPQETPDFSEYHLSKYRPIYMTYKKDDEGLKLEHRVEGADVKCVNLFLDRYAKLMSIKSDVDAAISQAKISRKFTYSRHLGGHVYVNVCSQYPCVDVRQFYMYDKQLKPTKQGVALHYAEWHFFKLAFCEVCEVIPHLETLKHCSDTHPIEKFEEALACKECFPY